MLFPTDATRKVLTGILLGILCGTCPAQQSPDASAQATSSVPGDTSVSAPGTSKDRLFFTLPNFLTLEDAANVPPLTAGEKFKATARGTFDYAEFAWYGAVAGVGQARNDEPEFGQGVEGYAKRYGEAFGDGTIENFMTKAILPSVLREDPRYFQVGKGGFAHRAWYAVTRVFVTRTDSGNNTFNFSEILGSAGAAGISTYTYHPESDRNLPTVASVWGTQVGYDTISNVVKEFWPDVRRKLHKAR